MSLRSLLPGGARANAGVWLCLLTIAVTVVAALVTHAWSAREARERATVTLTMAAEQIALKLDRGMFERYSAFYMLSTRPTLGDPAVAATEKQRLLDEMRHTHSSYAWIGATDVSGKVVAAAQDLLTGADVSQRPWFVNALKGRYVGDVHEAKLLAAKIPNPSGEPLRFVDIAFPYRDATGEIAGVLGAHINWTWADEVQRSVLSRHPAGGAETLIIANDGTVILGPKSSIGTTLPAAHGTRAQSAGDDYLAGASRTRGFQSYPGLGWTVIVRQPLDAALASAKTLARQVLWSGFGVAFVCLLFGFAMPRRFSRA